MYGLEIGDGIGVIERLKQEIPHSSLSLRPRLELHVLVESLSDASNSRGFGDVIRFV